MNAPSVDVAAILAAGGLGLTFATNLFVGQEPTEPDNVVTVFDTPGYPPQLSLDKTEVYEYPAIQVRVRNNSYLAGYELAADIKTLLHGLAHETWNNTRYELIRCMQDPFLLDYDENGRARFVINFDLQRR